MKGSTYVLAAAVAALVALPTAAASSRAGAAGYEDSAGEDPAGPDITNVSVSNDDAGMLTFKVNVPNRPQLGSDLAVIVFVDKDGDSSTGAADFGPGTEYALDLSQGSVDLARWTGSDWDYSGGSPSTLVYSYAGGASIKIGTKDLGIGSRFNFYVVAVSGQGPDAHIDFAPDLGHGVWAYELKTAAKKPVKKKAPSKKKRKP